MHAIRSKLKLADPGVKDLALGCFARSLLIYFGTPLVAAELIGKNEILKIEEGLYREIYLLPRDIKGTLITNVAQNQKSAWISISRLAKEVSTYNTR